MAQGDPQSEEVVVFRPPRREEPAGPAPGPAGWWRLAAIGAVALLAGLGALELAQLLARPLALLLAAIIIAQALAPPVAWLEHRLPRPAAVGLVYLALLLAVGGIGWVVVPPTVEQARTLAESGPGLLEEAEAWIDRLDRFDRLGDERLRETIQSRAGELVGLLVSLPLAIVSSVTEIVLVVVLSAYWLLSMPGLRRFTLSLFPPGRRPRAGEVLGGMGRTMGGYVRGTVIDGLIVGAITYVGLLVIGVDYPLVLALVAGLGELIPVAGPIIAAVPALVVALLESPTQALIVLVFYIVVQQFESYVLLPNIMRTQSDIPALLVLFAIFAGGSVGGLVGALIAIPLAGALRVLILEVVAPAVRRWSWATPEEAAAPYEKGG